MLPQKMKMNKLSNILTWLFDNIIQIPTTATLAGIFSVIIILNFSIWNFLYFTGIVIIGILTISLNFDKTAQKGLTELSNYLKKFPEIKFIEHDLSTFLTNQEKKRYLSSVSHSYLPRYFQIYKDKNKKIKKPSVISSFIVPSPGRVLISSIIFDYASPKNLDPIRRFRFFHELSHGSQNLIQLGRILHNIPIEFSLITIFSLAMITWNYYSFMLTITWLILLLSMLPFSSYSKKNYCWLECSTDVEGLKYISDSEIKFLYENVTVFKLLKDNKMTEVENQKRYNNLEKVISYYYNENSVIEEKKFNIAHFFDLIIFIITIIYSIFITISISKSMAIVSFLLCCFSYWYFDKRIWKKNKKIEALNIKEIETRLLQKEEIVGTEFEIDEEEMLNEFITLDSFLKYLTLKFPYVPYELYENHSNDIFSSLEMNKYHKIHDLELLFRITKESRERYQGQNSRLTQVSLCFGCIDSKFRNKMTWPKEAFEVFYYFYTSHSPQESYCHFCAREKDEVDSIISKDYGRICNHCVEDIHNLLSKKNKSV